MTFDFNICLFICLHVFILFYLFIYLKAKLPSLELYYCDNHMFLHSFDSEVVCLLTYACLKLYISFMHVLFVYMLHVLGLVHVYSFSQSGII